MRPHFSFYAAYLLGSLKHGTGMISPYWFERLRVKRTCYDMLVRYLTGIGA